MGGVLFLIKYVWLQGRTASWKEMESCLVEGRKCNSNTPVLLLKVAAIVCIFAACLIGVFLPMLGSKLKFLNVKGKSFAVLKAFSGGVVLGTAFVHMLPEAFDALGNKCLAKEWSNFPFAGLTAMIAVLGTLLLDVGATSFYARRKAETDTESEASKDFSAEQVRYRVISQVLELGMVAHSLIIGISLGASSSTCIVRPLVAALTFHQLFEGLALGGCISQAEYDNGSAATMGLVFSMTMPVGIGIGIGISSAVDTSSPNAIIVEGLLDSGSAGILIYMALVDLIATDFLTHINADKLRNQAVAFVSLVLGAGTMAFVALWA